MSSTADRLLREALQLSAEERAKLVMELLGSLEPSITSEDRTDDAWIAEIERRARAAIAGSPDMSWDEVRAKVRDRLQSK